jgi:hypothetical protein
MPRGVYKRKSETIEKMKIAHKGKIKSPEHCKNLSKSHIGKKKPWSNGKQNIGLKRTDVTRKKMSIAQKNRIMNGSNSFWKGGITNENKIIRSGIEYRLWREAVFARDNWTCQKYFTKGGELEAHHINNFSTKKNLRFAIDNGVTLSKKAHREFHKRYGLTNNTISQLKEFLSETVIKEI